MESSNDKPLTKRNKLYNLVNSKYFLYKLSIDEQSLLDYIKLYEELDVMDKLFESTKQLQSYIENKLKDLGIIVYPIPFLDVSDNYDDNDYKYSDNNWFEALGFRKYVTYNTRHENEQNKSKLIEGLFQEQIYEHDISSESDNSFDIVDSDNLGQGT